MKIYFTLLILIFSGGLKSQNLKTVKQELSSAFALISYWAEHKTVDDKVDPYDSLQIANRNFEKLLLKYTSRNTETLTYDFKELQHSGLRIATSSDRLFRIYSWDTRTGGTMRFFRNVFQYKTKKTVRSKTIYSDDSENDPGCSYYSINDVISKNKEYYVAQTISKFSSALLYYNFKVFTITDELLIDTAKLIKTKSGIMNELGYEVDFTSLGNRLDKANPDFSSTYDPKRKLIIIPLILDNGRITTRKIIYKFTGQYFEKL